MRCGRELMLAFALMGAPPAHAADALAVDVVNASEPTLCAEKDNVYLAMQSAEVFSLAAKSMVRAVTTKLGAVPAGGKA